MKELKQMSNKRRKDDNDSPDSSSQVELQMVETGQREPLLKKLLC